MFGRIFLGWTSTKQGLMSLAQGHNTMTPVRLKPAAFGLESSTLPLSHCAPVSKFVIFYNFHWCFTLIWVYNWRLAFFGVPLTLFFQAITFVFCLCNQDRDQDGQNADPDLEWIQTIQQSNSVPVWSKDWINFACIFNRYISIGFRIKFWKKSADDNKSIKDYGNTQHAKS